MAVDELLTPILVILGPTASGKSELALRIAGRTGSEILSLDSMQVYREMNIGTAKPSAAERAEVKHHLIDEVEANEGFTVARFVSAADEVIAEARQRGVSLIATGGTPLYYKALFEGLFEGPGANDTVRERLRRLSNEELHRRLEEVDSAAAGRIHLADTKRMVRALEVFELTGRPISALQTEWAGRQMRHRATWIGLNWERDALNRRINARVKGMMAGGWLRETQRLLEKFGSLSSTAAEATGYHELTEHLRGQMSLDEAVEQIKIATRQLARRQMKWFRRFPHVNWLAGDREVGSLVEEAIALWRGTTPGC